MIIENQKDVTNAVLAEIAALPMPGSSEIMSAFVRHLHDFAREVKLTEQEFQAAVGLRRRASASTPTRATTRAC